MTDSLGQSRSVAIKALNECHAKHGMKKIMGCDFCTSLANEMTIARHYEPFFDRIRKLEAQVVELRDGNEYILVRELREKAKELEAENLGLQDEIEKYQLQISQIISFVHQGVTKQGEQQ